VTPAKHNRLADVIFHIYLYRLFKKHFASFHLMDDFPSVDPNLPVLLIANHSTWWDGFFIYFLNRTYFKRELFVMMLEVQLSNFPFFTRLGAYGIHPESTAEVKASLRYTVKLLSKKTNSGVMVCIFPQGEMQTWSDSTVVFRRGIDVVIRKYQKPVTLLPLSIRAEFLQEQRPQVFFLFGQPEIVEATKFDGIVAFERVEEKLMQTLSNKINHGEQGKLIYRGKQSIHRRILNRHSDVGKETRWNT